MGSEFVGPADDPEGGPWFAPVVCEGALAPAPLVPETPEPDVAGLVAVVDAGAVCTGVDCGTVVVTGCRTSVVVL